MRVQDYDTSERFHATIVSTERITPSDADEVREIVLDVDRAGLDLVVGQSIGVLVPEDEELAKKDRLRLYSIADLPRKSPEGHPRVRLLVKRVTYIDEYNGERYEGVASAYLCDRRPGDELTLAGPYGLPFEVPRDPEANLILVATGTGIAPFRAFVRYLYEEADSFVGRVWLFYGGRTGLDLLYMNDERDDFAQYYDKDTFEAFRVLSPRPHWTDDIAWGDAIEARGQELWKLLSDPKTYVYVAGMEKVRESLDQVFSKIAGDRETWNRRKAELVAGRRWVELLY